MIKNKETKRKIILQFVVVTALEITGFILTGIFLGGSPAGNLIFASLAIFACLYSFCYQGLYILNKELEEERDNAPNYSGELKYMGDDGSKTSVTLPPWLIESCPRCSNPLEENSSFCVKCGLKLK